MNQICRTKEWVQSERWNTQFNRNWWTFYVNASHELVQFLPCALEKGPAREKFNERLNTNHKLMPLSTVRSDDPCVLIAMKHFERNSKENTLFNIPNFDATDWRWPSSGVVEFFFRLKFYSIYDKLWLLLRNNSKRFVSCNWIFLHCKAAIFFIHLTYQWHLCHSHLLVLYLSKMQPYGCVYFTILW